MNKIVFNRIKIIAGGNSMISKEKYIELCEKKDDIGVYGQPWWLNACCGIDNWNVAVVEKNGNIVAALPFYIKHKYTMKYITVPPRTQTCGLWLDYPRGIKYQGKLQFENEVVSELISDIENYSKKNGIVEFRQSYAPEFTNWTPFLRLGYNQTTKYTYRFEQGFEYELAWQKYTSGLKNEIKKARKTLAVKETEDIDLMYELYTKTMSRKEKEPGYSKEFVANFDKECKIHNSRKIFVAVDTDGVYHGILYIAYDKKWVYYLFGGTDPELRKYNSSSLLVDSAIKYAAENHLGFDFEGSVTPGVEEFFRKFGGEQTPYFSISKVYSKNPLLRLLVLARLSRK